MQFLLLVLTDVMLWSIHGFKNSVTHKISSIKGAKCQRNMYFYMLNYPSAHFIPLDNWEMFF